MATYVSPYSVFQPTAVLCSNPAVVNKCDVKPNSALGARRSFFATSNVFGKSRKTFHRDSCLVVRNEVDTGRTVKITLPVGKQGSEKEQEIQVPLKSKSSKAFIIDVSKPLGIVFEEDTSVKKGVFVKELTKDSSARRAGVQIGDRLVATTASGFTDDLNGNEAANCPVRETYLFLADNQDFDQVMNAIRSSPGGVVSMVFERD
eukprot:CAMPEP_0196656852 /NCGR_PEP_ID=MMETSP1086-20130531/19896_1 /TAXON_ID=77921 /ORGANISM="Cyanoptyche  gloeocystis , Strain SAG4.97" /LENGTH=203 /DNA_ID=CAMNT_0041989745 /DNA_START=116 /DNA_END=727 /DNA_ORIENTATION=-